MMADAGRGAAVDRVTRTMSLALGVGATVFALLALSGFLTQFSAIGPVWSCAAAIGIFGPPIAAAALSQVAPIRLLRALAGVCAAAHLVALVTLVPVLPGGKLASELGSPWLYSVSVIATAAVAVASRRGAITWPYVTLCIVALGLGRYLASPDSIPELAFQDALHTLLFDAIFTALALATYRAGRLLDATADTAIAETRAVATKEASARERTRVEALLHDSVLVALLASSRGSQRAPEQARAGLDELDDVDRSDDAVLDATAWVWRLQALTTDIAPDAQFSHDDPLALGTEPLEAQPLDIPSDAAQAVLEATAEALRNSVLHAGPAARAVHATVAGDAIRVTVLDNGRGFDPAHVRPGRLGVTVSILDRMRALPGGRADVVSRPGVGTRVSINWQAVPS
jgi:signal transduction histidine kinase